MDAGRWLDGEPADDAAQLRAFERALVLVVAGEYAYRALAPAALPAPLLTGVAAVLASAALVLVSPWRRTGLALLALAHLGVMALEFPASGNHAHLQLVLLAILALVDAGRAEERRLALRAGRWVVVVVLFAAGLQKFANGYWVRGQYLAWAFGTESYRPVLEPLLPPPEAARLAALDDSVGAGPYLVASPALVAVSNAVWIAELALAPLLVVRRTRTLALVAAITLVLAIEVAAREAFFGLVMIDGLLLFGPARTQRGFVWLAVAAVAALLLVRLGLLPEATFR